MPAMIHDLLSSSVFLVVARVVLTSFFWIAGLFSLFNFESMAKIVEREGLPAPRAVLALMIVTELAGSTLLISDYRSLGWLGAGALGVFTFLSIPLGHPFWKYDPPKKMQEFQIALEHLGMIGGLMCAAILTIDR